MHRRKVILTAAAVFAIGVAFAAQPTLLRAHWHKDVPRGDSLWVPGTDSLVSAHEDERIMPPPR